MKKIILVDSLLIQLSDGPYTVHKMHPLYTKFRDAQTEEEINKLKNLKYDFVYAAYLIDNKLVIKEYGPYDTSTYDLNGNWIRANLEEADILGNFISKEDLINEYPEYYI